MSLLVEHSHHIAGDRTTSPLSALVAEDPTSELGLLVSVLREAGYVLVGAGAEGRSLGIARSARPDLNITPVPADVTAQDVDQARDVAFTALNAKLLEEVDELREAVVLAGVLHERSAQADVPAMVLTDGTIPSGPRAIDVLSRRELEVLGLIAEGAPNSEVAGRLFIAETTVQSHVQHILRKLHARNRTEATTRFLRG